MSDEDTYDCTMAFRAVNAFDVMTAEAPWNDKTGTTYEKCK